MALCTDCGTALPGNAKNCRTCGAQRACGREREAATVPVASFSAMNSEMAIAEVHLVTAATPSEVHLDPAVAPGAADAPTASRRVGRVLAVTGLVLLCAAIVLMLGSLVGGFPWN